MSMIIVKSVAASLVSTVLETKYGPDLGEGSMGLPKLFGVSPVILTGLGFWVLMHGFLVVGPARGKYMKLAKEAGEKDVEERYALPNIYAQGTSPYAIAFNCIQRSHQHVFETFPQMCIMSMIGAVHYPLTGALTLATYAIGRIAVSNCYANANGDASKRYASPFSIFMWYGYVATCFVSMASSISFVLGKPVL